MEKKIILGVIVASALIIAVSFFMPAGPPQQQVAQFLPWQIAPAAGGSTRIFGLVLDRSTLQEAEQQFQGDAEISLFVSPAGQYRVEAYFDKVVLGGFSARMVLVMGLSGPELAGMLARGARISNLGDGEKKVSLAGEDLQRVRLAPISSITYLTRARLDRELLLQRFGEPGQRLQDPQGAGEHWLYPEKGLDIIVDEGGKAVLQYISPRRFGEVLQPLLDARRNGPDSG